MDRERLEELLTGLLDEQLTSEERAELDQELKQSESARALLESYRAQARDLSALAAEPLPAPLKAATRRLIDSSPAPSSGKSRGTNLLWLLGSVAACLALFFASHALQPGAHEETMKLYLSDHGIVNRPVSEIREVALRPVSDPTRALSIQSLEGIMTGEQAVVVLEGDGGESAGQQLRLRLSLDIDGDQEFDIVQESELIPIDGTPGYETLVGRFPTLPATYHGRTFNGGARLELIGHTLNEPGLSLQFRPEHSHLILPLRASAVL